MTRTSLGLVKGFYNDAHPRAAAPRALYTWVPGICCAGVDQSAGKRFRSSCGLDRGRRDRDGLGLGIMGIRGRGGRRRRGFLLDPLVGMHFELDLVATL